MQAALLIFPDVNSLSDFIQRYEVYGVEVNTRELSLSGKLSNELVYVALTEYRAYQKPFYGFPYSSGRSGLFDAEA
jgi:hypothetical protein